MPLVPPTRVVCGRDEVPALSALVNMSLSNMSTYNLHLAT
jgi:hypothetical protein